MPPRGRIQTARRVLVVEGNSRRDRVRIAETSGATPAQRYAAVLRSIAGNVVADICTPADPDATMPLPLDAYDGVAITGSALNIYRREPESLRQIDLAREIFARGIPMFGSCWGLQLATVAAGGDVAPNPAGREVAFARKITLTAAGRGHPLHARRDAAFDAPAIHGDIVTRVPSCTVVTACNAMSAVQAAEIRAGRGVFWGVQYHPEYRLEDIAAMIRRQGRILVDEGFFADIAETARYAEDLMALGADRRRTDIAWRLGLDRDVIDDDVRHTELANWVAHLAPE